MFIHEINIRNVAKGVRSTLHRSTLHRSMTSQVIAQTPSNSDQTSNLEWRCSFFLQNVNQIDMFFCYGQSTKIHFKSLSSTFKENDYFGSNTCLNVAHPILYLSTLTSFVNIKNGRNLCNHQINTERKHCFCLCNKPKIIIS